jgi:hypothetical protein
LMTFGTSFCYFRSYLFVGVLALQPLSNTTRQAGEGSLEAGDWRVINIHIVNHRRPVAAS